MRVPTIDFLSDNESHTSPLLAFVLAQSVYSFSRFLRNASPVSVGLLVALFGLGHLSLQLHLI
jgi:hypothetical protein